MIILDDKTPSNGIVVVANELGAPSAITSWLKPDIAMGEKVWAVRSVLLSTVNTILNNISLDRMQQQLVIVLVNRQEKVR
jgi:hypothetical protein